MSSVGMVYITWNRIKYVKRSLPALLKRTNMDFSLYIVDNASTDGTFEYVSQDIRDKRIKAVIRNKRNMGQIIPINWFWRNCDYDLLGKFDDDIIVSEGWLEKIAGMFNGSGDMLGAIGGCHLDPEDIKVARYQHNIMKYEDGRMILCQPYIGGCCYLIHREVFRKNGPININWTEYQFTLHKRGYVNGYVYPFIMIINMADPRRGMENTEYKSYAYPNVPLSFWRKDSIRLLEGRWKSA